MRAYSAISPENLAVVFTSPTQYLIVTKVGFIKKRIIPPHGLVHFMEGRTPLPICKVHKHLRTMRAHSLAHWTEKYGAG